MEQFQKEGYAEQKKYRAYKKTVSIVDESAISMFQGIAKDHISFLLESYDKNYDRYSFFGVDPKALVSSTRKGLLIQYRDGTKEEIQGNVFVKVSIDLEDPQNSVLIKDSILKNQIQVSLLCL